MRRPHRKTSRSAPAGAQLHRYSVRVRMTDADTGEPYGWRTLYPMARSISEAWRVALAYCRFEGIELDPATLESSAEEIVVHQSVLCPDSLHQEGAPT